MNRRGLLAALATAQAITPLVRAADARQREPLQVGATRSIRTIAEAARLARNGDRIEVDAGDYVGDVALWQQDDLTLNAVGGRVRLLANGAAVEGKGIWVMRGGRVTVKGFDFSGAAVPSGNGAGIRLDRGWLTVRDCTFVGNEAGILTSNDAAVVLEVQTSEFAQNTRPDGQTHHLYTGSIKHLAVSGCYFHHVRGGHLLKSRAAVSEILYNRLTDESGGQASYELEFSGGGIAIVVGNIISQTDETQNPNLISIGAEGYKWPANELYLVNNTLIDRPERPGIFLTVRPGADLVVAKNNLLVGSGTTNASELADEPSNLRLSLAEFKRQTDAGFRLRPDSPLVGRFTAPGSAHGRNLTPEREYDHPRGTVALTTPAHNPGAMQGPAPVRR